MKTIALCLEDWETVLSWFKYAENEGITDETDVEVFNLLQEQLMVNVN